VVACGVATGEFDAEAIAHYAEWLGYARSRVCRRMVVLWHFTNPAWLADDGGWLSKEGPNTLRGLRAQGGPDLAPLVDWWATLNEANTYARHGWLTGEWPPGRRNDVIGGFAVYARPGRRASPSVRSHQAALWAGCARRAHSCHPWTHPPLEGGRFSGACEAFWNWLGAWNFLDRVRESWTGSACSTTTTVPAERFTYDLEDGRPPGPTWDGGSRPEGLYRVIRASWDRYGVPILVTENGLADGADRQRGRFILDHLAWLHRAIAEGATCADICTGHSSTTSSGRTDSARGSDSPRSTTRRSSGGFDLPPSSTNDRTSEPDPDGMGLSLTYA
jgi:beta-glucosidase